MSTAGTAYARPSDDTFAANSRMFLRRRYAMQIRVKWSLRSSSSKRLRISTPNDSLIVEADFDSRLEHGKKRRDVEITRCI